MIVLAKKEDCTGCFACASTCPTGCICMESDEEGFLYPSADEADCTMCGLCAAVCPVRNQYETHGQPEAFACRNKDDSTRLQSSSGGIFSALAEQVIRDGGVVFGAVFDGSSVVSHTYIDTTDQLSRLRGSKYVQSRIGESYCDAKRFLEQGRQVLFSGTPCQIGGLLSYLGKPHDNLLCIDLICCGVPSPKLWERYLSFRKDRAGSSIHQVSFRDKTRGWRQASVRILFTNGAEYRQTHEKDPYMRTFSSCISLRPSCYVCKFRTLSRQSDLTLGDFWGIEQVLASIDDDLGTSLVLVHSEKGVRHLYRIRQELIELRSVDVEAALQYNPRALRSVEIHPKRDAFFRDFDRLPFDRLVDRYCRMAIAARARRRFAAGVRRILRRLKPGGDR